MALYNHYNRRKRFKEDPKEDPKGDSKGGSKGGLRRHHGPTIRGGGKSGRPKKADPGRTGATGGKSWVRTPRGDVVEGAVKDFVRPNPNAPMPGPVRNRRGGKSGRPKKADPGRTGAKGGKNWNVGVSKGGVSFKEAFKHFRDKGQKTFSWNGSPFTTELDPEPKKGSRKKAARKKGSRKKAASKKAKWNSSTRLWERPRG